MSNGIIVHVLKDELLKDIIKSMEWMIKDLRFKFHEAQNVPMSQPTNYSSELILAVNVLEKLKHKQPEGRLQNGQAKRDN